MHSNNGITRKEFINASLAVTGMVFLPGIGRIEAKPFAAESSLDYNGRFCYNENPLGPSPLALAAIQNASSMSHRYPDWYSSNLESRIAAKHGLNADYICTGNGATEVIRLIADAFLSPGDEVITATPTYFQMASEAASNGASVVHVPVNENHVIDLNAIAQAIGPNTRMISLVNPNNPLGTIINKSDMAVFLSSLPDRIIVVVDEAYHHYVSSPHYESCIRFVKQGLPVIVVRTFSKVYGLAGARIGYSVASETDTANISSSQLFGTVSNLAQAAAEAALNDLEHVTKTINLNNSVKNYLESEFTGMGLNFIPSETNFMMLNTGLNAAGISSKLASRGYLVSTGWGMPYHIRISTGLMAEMEGFVAALGEILENGNNDHVHHPDTFALNSIYPNPFNSQCNISISTIGSECAKLTIYDMLGRKVRTLLNRKLGPGEHRMIWDGKDTFGIPVASGVYVFNLMQGEYAASARAILTK